MHIFSTIKKKYESLRIQSKLLLSIIIASTTPMVVMSVFFSARLYRMVTSDTIRTEQASVSEAAPYLTASLTEIRETFDQIRNLDFAVTLFDAPVTEAPEEMLLSEDAAEFAAQCEALIEDTPVTAVRVYTDISKDNYAFTSKDTIPVFSSLDEIRSTYWYGIFYSSHPSYLFCPPLYMSRHEKDGLGDCAYIRPVYIRDENGESLRSFIACYFRSTDLQTILLNNLSQQGSLSYITNERDAMVTTTDESLSGIYYMNYESIQNNLMSSNGFIEKQILSETVYMSSYYLPDANWFLVTVTPTQPIHERAVRMWWAIVLLWVGAAVVSMLLAMFLSRSLTRRINVVIDQMSHVKDGPPVPISHMESESDEIGELVDSYNYMTEQINNLIEEQNHSAEELRVAEFNSLQAQINPHFLYNTMEMINWMAQQGRIKETNTAIRNLSKFYKLTLSKKSSMSTIEDEIEHVSIYVSLQNMRFDNGIDFVVDIPDSLYECSIPRLTLQPILENSILHGILEKESRTGTIVLTGWQEGDDIVLLISDDGVGIEAKRLASLLTGTVVPSNKGNQIAVYNTHRRLQILYGEGYGLSYSSTEGVGTEVSIRVPFKV